MNINKNIYNLLPIIVFLYLLRTSAYKGISLLPHGEVKSVRTTIDYREISYY
ncbi:hypothetical protein CAPGI0001_0673 [Capnocytophaga gingivalis ATCC 33624]|nr:hypothetical protein CAPGI0001_0673 [Capnocytophaga gingivalis ATCC 33624]